VIKADRALIEVASSIARHAPLTADERGQLAADGGLVQLTGSYQSRKKPHGLHLNTFRFSAKARLLACS
jgi:hypothetical protein